MTNLEVTLTLRRLLWSSASSRRPLDSRYRWQFCSPPSRRVPEALQSWVLAYEHRLLKRTSANSTAMPQNHSLQNWNLAAPNTPNSGLNQEHAGKTRKVVTCRWKGTLWLVEKTDTSARRNLGWKIPASDWSRRARHLLTLQFDSCGKNICSLYSVLLWSLLTNFGVFTSSPWKHAITHMLCALGKCKTNWATMTLSHCICVTQKDNNSACFLKIDPEDAFFTWF